MIVLKILLILLLLLFTTLLVMIFMPFYFVVDSRHNIIAFEWQPLFKINVLFNEGNLRLKLKIFFFKMSTEPLKWSKSKSSQNAKKKKPKKKAPRWLKRKIIPILNSFKIEKFYFTLDTDDYCKNAYLYPLFKLFSNRKNRKLSINFNGETQLTLIIQNRLSRIIKVILK